ncbi:MAG: hypothetical protein GJ680_11400 [Alteromonadaceae bacterium]|nr:hypothetical protein [Alteromonadaceae bacterium]
MENYPEIQRLDIGASFPEPRPNEASGLFGLAISTIAISLFGKNASINDIAMTAAWGAPVLTVITYLLTFLLVRLLSNTSVALIAITFFLLYPGKTLDRGVLGFVDHHAAEYCLSLAIAIGLVTLMKPSGNKSTFHNWKIALYSVLPLILLIFTWQGAEIFLLIVCITILICWNFAVFRRDDVTLLTITNARYGIVLLLIITATTRNTLITQGASALILGAWIYTMIFKHYTQPRLAQHISVCVTVLAAAILFMLAYFTEVGRFLTSLVLAKSTNLIHEESEVNLALYLGQFGIVGVLAAIGMIVVPFSVLRSLLPLGAMVPIMFLAMWCALWWSSSDFGYYLPAFVSVCAALALYSLWLIAKPNAFGVNLSKNKHIKIGVFTLFAGVLALPVYPFQFVSSPWIDRHKLTAMTTYSEAWYESLAWFEENSPQPARTPLSSSKQKTNEQNQNIDDYGIMVAWDFGNIVASHGNRIPVWSSVPSAYTARWMLAQSEDESFEILSERQTDTKTIRYVIVDKDTYGPLINAKSKFTDSPIKAKKTGVLNVNGQFIPHIRLDETFQNSMVSRLYGNDGIELSHYRLVFESQHLTYSSGFLQ